MEGKYHTIDPLILETLNLNERRMNHILDIIHGRQPKDYSNLQHRRINKSQSITLNKSHTINHSLPKDDSALPPIIRTLNIKQESKFDKVAQVSPITQRGSRTIEKSRRSERSDMREGSLKGRKQNRDKAEEEAVNIEEEVRLAQAHRKEQVMRDYMYTKLKKSKSMEVNPKDLYRIEIEHLVAEPTPIELMEQAERKMQRLKKRCKHLLTFDKAYYSRLNQQELLNLS